MSSHLPLPGVFLCRRDYALPPKEFGYSFTWLSAPTQPLTRLIVINLERLGAGARVVMPDDLDKRPVSRRPLVGHHDAVVRLLSKALSSQADSQHVFLYLCSATPRGRVELVAQHYQTTV